MLGLNKQMLQLAALLEKGRDSVIQKEVIQMFSDRTRALLAPYMNSAQGDQLFGELLLMAMKQRKSKKLNCFSWTTNQISLFCLSLARTCAASLQQHPERLDASCWQGLANILGKSVPNLKQNWLVLSFDNTAWSKEENSILRQMLEKAVEPVDWPETAIIFYSLSESHRKKYRNSKCLRKHWQFIKRPLEKVRWSPVQDLKLISFIIEKGKTWRSHYAQLLPGRTLKSLEHRLQRLKREHEIDLALEQNLVRLRSLLVQRVTSVEVVRGPEDQRMKSEEEAEEEAEEQEDQELYGCQQEQKGEERLERSDDSLKEYYGFIAQKRKRAESGRPLEQKRVKLREVKEADLRQAEEWQLCLVHLEKALLYPVARSQFSNFWERPCKLNVSINIKQ